jgi:hypothetical protein
MEGQTSANAGDRFGLSIVLADLKLWAFGGEDLTPSIRRQMGGHLAARRSCRLIAKVPP